MRSRPEWHQIQEAIATHVPSLRPAQQRGLAWWVYGAILAQNACHTAVIGARLTVGAYHAVRQYLREWLYDGPDRAAPGRTEVDVTLCIAPILGWIVSCWQGSDLAVAVDRPVAQPGGMAATATRPDHHLSCPTHLTSSVPTLVSRSWGKG